MSFNTGLSGIRAANTDLSVTGNNIANAGTIGFKSSRAEFGDVYTSSLLGGGSTVPGSGVTTLTLRQAFGQGNLKFTQNAMDLSVNGAGFFVLDGKDGQLFSRAGAFGLDKDGNIVNSTGASLQGFAADANGNVGGILTKLKVDVNTQAPRQTTGVKAAYNLNANEKVLKTTGNSFVSDGSAVGVAKTGLKAATTQTYTLTPPLPATAGVLTTPLNFNTVGGNPTSFRLTLTPPAPGVASSVDINLNAGTATKLQEVANLINSANFASATPVNFTAVVNGSNIEFRDATKGVASTITVGPIPPAVAMAATASALTAGLAGMVQTTAGVPQVTNGYLPQTLVIQGPTGASVNFVSDAGATAAATASKLNGLAGISATATTKATIQAAGFDNTNGNLILNGVRLTALTTSALATQINALTSSTLPGVTAAVVNAAGDLEIESKVGSDLSFSFSDKNAAGATIAPAVPGVYGSVTISGSGGTPQPPLTDAVNAVVVGGSLKIVMESGYSIKSATPVVGNLFSPLSPTSFTPVLINAFDPADPKSYNHATSSTVYDSLGNSHIMRSYFVKEKPDATAANHWKMFVQIDGQNVGDPDPSLPSPDNTKPTMASYDLYFSADGTLNTALTDTLLISNWTPIGADGNPVGALPPLNVLQGGTTPVAEPPSSSNFVIDLAGSTQFGSSFSVENLDQNGYTTGRLAGLDVDSKGILFARFTNGEAQTLGQVALANFNNVEGLKPVGNSMWAQTFETGEAIIGAPGSSSLGNITSGALEESNVDLSEELVNLIIAQRNYQANAKTIETANATTQTIINLR
ncbi:flagellar hook-basal body complex protein [Cellvibrio sp.]|uniref:flagellar hook-basal body complex protein n=1 Tax=Cellvibrio sp. TaxID=1965322 RepID=UPI0039648C8E